MTPRPPRALLLTHHKLSSVLANEFMCIVCRLLELDGSGTRTCLVKWWQPGNVCGQEMRCCIQLGIRAQIDGAQSYTEVRPPQLPAANESAENLASLGSPAAELLRRVLPRWSMTVHILRDPFEAVVSGYLYHRRGAEAYWTSHPLANSQGQFTPLRGTAQVARAIRHDELRGVRGRAALRPGTNYSGLLRRLGTRDGLWAEAVRTLRATDGLGHAFAVSHAIQRSGWLLPGWPAG